MSRQVVARLCAWGQRTRTSAAGAGERPRGVEALESRRLLAAAMVYAGPANPSTSPEGGEIIYFPINLSNADVMTNRTYTVDYSVTGTALPASGRGGAFWPCEYLSGSAFPSGY